MRPIDADKLIDQIDIIRLYSREADDSDQLSGAVVKKFIQSQPTIDLEGSISHGQWQGEGDGYAETVDGEMAIVFNVWNCSVCGHCIDDGTDDVKYLSNYCPNCGAKMDRE